jgi:hypothetical protein
VSEWWDAPLEYEPDGTGRACVHDMPGLGFVLVLIPQVLGWEGEESEWVWAVSQSVECRPGSNVALAAVMDC